MTAEHTRLTSSLRDLRARTGLSLAALAERTTYSKSSWERYLNGKSMPPRQAVHDLCRIAGEPEGRLLALWEIAESEWSGRAATPAPPAPEPAAQEDGNDAREGHGPPPRNWGRLVMVLAAACAVTVTGVTLALLLPGGDPERGARPAPPSVLSGSGPANVVATRCRGTSCEGHDPVDMVCGVSPAKIATHRTAGGADMEVRYSRQCGAAWARMTGARIGDRVDIKGAGPAHEAVVADRRDTVSYVVTGMAAARPGDSLRFCFHPEAKKAPCECFETTVKK